MNKNVNVNMIIESKSKYDFNATIEKLTEVIQLAGWKMPAAHDLQNTIRIYGKEVLPIKVLETCHPKHSSRLLELDNERIVSTFMPCRISVYEKSDGNTYISRINGAALSKNFGGIIEEVMTSAYNEMEDMLASLVR
jgi:uncharacterized protein (DUF302 family)